MSPYSIRVATIAAVPTMAEIRRDDAEAGGADARMADYLAGRHHPQQALAPRVVCLAAVEGVLAGYIAGHLTRRHGCDGEVQYLYVAPGHRRTGVASAMLRRLAQWFVEQRATRICVNVNAESPGAESFYLKHRAQPLGPHWMMWSDIRTILG